ncbi:PhzF family phenazine biosynthesis protein [Comamonas composti]|uniref:PhzF family phenazine biosynthesis protein n=1 Tax=Comamonas composti TaxID=408558 RepID=UPI00040B03F7|nr:PhzF family phenazine biosynthesis protein [Comamonas composti]
MTSTSPRHRPFTTVDVFTHQPYQGNPLAVVQDATDLGAAQMQAFAAWTNLSETAFLLPPTEAGRAQGADYRVRIFTPVEELPFAGHPTLGSCHAWLAGGGQPLQAGCIVQECGKGLVPIRRDGRRLAFAAPATQIRPLTQEQRAGITRALGVEPGQILHAAALDNGPLWMTVVLDDPERLLALQPDHGLLKRLGYYVGTCALYEHDFEPAALIGRSSREARAFATGQRQAAVQDEPRLEVRGFTSPAGIAEDPVTGSLNASLAVWLRELGLLRAPYLASQGQCVGRDGQIHVSEDEQGRLWIGGEVVDCVTGQVLL